MKHIDWVPRWARWAAGLLALLNIAYGVMGYVDISTHFTVAAQGLDLKHPGLVHAGYEFAARNLAIGLALAIVALKGVPESIAIVTIIRALVELQTIVLAVLGGSVGVALAMPVAFLVAEIVIIRAAVSAVKARDGATNKKGTT
jgi:hypothetical protein